MNHSIFSKMKYKLSQLVGRKCMGIRNKNLETHHSTLLVASGHERDLYPNYTLSVGMLSVKAKKADLTLRTLKNSTYFIKQNVLLTYQLNYRHTLIE